MECVRAFATRACARDARVTREWHPRNTTLRGPERTGPDRTALDSTALDSTALDSTALAGPDRRSAVGGRRSRAAAAAAAAARGMDGGAEALGGGGGDGLWCACSEINLFKKIVKKKLFKKKTHPYTAAVGRAACLFCLFVLGHRALRRNCAP